MGSPFLLGDTLLKPYMLKVRGGSATYIKPDGSVGTAGKGALWSEDVAFTIAATQDQTLFAPVDFRHYQVGEPTDAVGTLQAKNSGGYSLNYQPGVTDGYIVRRLTPIECERLQGFPDDWTNLAGADPDEILKRMPQYAETDEKGKKALERKVRKWCKETPDGPRHKCCGNAFAAPVVRWIGERIQMVEEIASELEEEQRLDQALQYQHDVGFDEGYQVGYEDGFADGSNGRGQANAKGSASL